MTRVEWANVIRNKIARLADAQLSATTHDPYRFRRSYQAQMALFREWVNLDSEQTIIAGACAVYGWMPTMLKRIGHSHQPFVSLARRIVRLGLRDAAEVLDTLSEDEGALLLQHINGSTVGTSKFLHFASQGNLPIWDSRVAHALGVRSGWQKPDQYIRYAGAMSDVLGNGELVIPPNLRAFVEAEGGVSETRIVEFGLYVSR